MRRTFCVTRSSSCFALASVLCLLASSCSIFKPKERPPTTATYHDGKRSVTIVVPHDPTPSPLLGLLEAIVGPVFSFLVP